MTLIHREYFLKKMWQPYPVCPAQALHRGRILSMQLVSGAELRLTLANSFSNTVDLQISAAELSIRPDLGVADSVNGHRVFSGQELSVILRPGDWIAISLINPNLDLSVAVKPTVDFQLSLLSPYLQQMSAQTVSVSDESVGQMSMQTGQPPWLPQWMDFLNHVRTFFRGKNLLEVQTPTLVNCPGTEPFLDLFSTELVMGSRRQKFYLPTSPELSLKKLLAQGYSEIFEIKNCFRNGEISERHQPEFYMLEWYRTFCDLSQIQQDISHLFEYLAEVLPNSRYYKKTFQFHKKSMSQLFADHLQFELTPTTSIEELKVLAAKLGLHAQDYNLWDDVFYLIFIEKIEPFLDSTEPLFVEKYPPSQAALARLTDDGWGDRFELYWQGLELANAFHELNDPVLQEQRFNEDLEKKKQTGREVPPLDTDFIKALYQGMPPAAGIALGLERLFMVFYGIADIGEIRR